MDRAALKVRADRAAGRLRVAAPECGDDRFVFALDLLSVGAVVPFDAQADVVVARGAVTQFVDQFDEARPATRRVDASVQLRVQDSAAPRLGVSHPLDHAGDPRESSADSLVAANSVASDSSAARIS